MSLEWSPGGDIGNMRLRKKPLHRIDVLAFVLAIVLASVLPASAKLHYRGFVEGGIGTSIIIGESNLEYSLSNGGGVAFGYMLATTHGFQFKKQFIGIGLGITPGYSAIGSYICTNGRPLLTGVPFPSEEYYVFDGGQQIKLSMPVYANWRYDFFSDKKSWNPFIGAKIGYFLPVSNHSYSYIIEYISGYGGYSTLSWDIHSKGFPIFFSVDFGARKRISNHSGLSFGLSVQSGNNACMRIDYPKNHMDNEMGINILAKVAFDF